MAGSAARLRGMALALATGVASLLSMAAPAHATEPSLSCPAMGGWSISTGTLTGDQAHGYTYECVYFPVQRTRISQATITVVWLDRGASTPAEIGCGVPPTVLAAVTKSSDTVHAYGWATSSVHVPQLPAALDALMRQVTSTAAPCTAQESAATTSARTAVSLAPRIATARLGRSIALTITVRPELPAGSIVVLQFYGNGVWMRQGELPIKADGTWHGKVTSDTASSMRFRALVQDAAGKTLSVSRTARLTWTRR